ncbi:replication-associated protein [Avon-Heathcote Estuary associated circular virus 19]|uniref:replication-associated protein n=1 Tax=Avon-Heathcote Estuary associated circular virus 19 TaxID=1618242 RepID=UPI0005CCE42A|nr:replication-associated protein [Avon-Heathcote Estuary associated circular virus 19]AJP36446.1 replication-associated protein [Avon-Heathcote Estuary associated circular virus 19]
MSRKRNWCFTLFPDQDGYYTDNIADMVSGDYDFEEQKIRFIIFQEEICPESSRRHLQGYVEYTVSRRLAAVKLSLGSESVHLEGRRGTASEAAEYCEKEDSFAPDGIRFQWGELGGEQGARSDLATVASAVISGKRVEEVALEFPTTFIRYNRGIEKLTNVVRRKEQMRNLRMLKVVVLWGDAGTGKTRTAFELSPDHYILSQQDGQLWWDGYEGQKHLIIDDFYGWIKWGLFLRILDIYPLQLPVKGGFTIASWDVVFITSNCMPRNWYERGMPAELARRLTHIVEFESYETDFDKIKEILV